MYHNIDEVFQIGIEIEKNGKKFYTQAALKTEEADLKRFFNDLAGWESKHISLFEKRTGISSVYRLLVYCHPFPNLF